MILNIISRNAEQMLENITSNILIISKLDFGPIRNNLIDIQVPTFLFLPHCPKQLTNNLLYANWSPDGLIKWVHFASNRLMQTLFQALSDIQLVLEHC